MRDWLGLGYADWLGGLARARWPAGCTGRLVLSARPADGRPVGNPPSAAHRPGGWNIRRAYSGQGSIQVANNRTNGKFAAPSAANPPSMSVAALKWKVADPATVAWSPQLVSCRRATAPAHRATRWSELPRHCARNPPSCHRPPSRNTRHRPSRATAPANPPRAPAPHPAPAPAPAPHQPRHHDSPAIVPSMNAAYEVVRWAPHPYIAYY